jgi:hypothetical protein
MSVKICPVLLCRRSFQRIFPQLEIFFDPGRNLAERGYKLLIINYGYIPVLGTQTDLGRFFNALKCRFDGYLGSG